MIQIILQAAERMERFPHLRRVIKNQINENII